MCCLLLCRSASCVRGKFLWRVSSRNSARKIVLRLTGLVGSVTMCPPFVTFFISALAPTALHIRCQHFPALQWLNNTLINFFHFGFQLKKLVNHKLRDTTCELSPNSALVSVCKLVCCSMGALIIKKFFLSILLYAQ